MKRKSIFIFATMMFMLFILSACSTDSTENVSSVAPSQSSTRIYLYGEAHGIPKILEKEFELWYDYYHNESMRHLFVELPYYTAEFLNQWLQSDSDEILDGIFDDWVGSPTYNPDVKAFYKKIKKQCPETVFHGTDVGHQYSTTGKRYLEYLENNNLQDSNEYTLTQEAIEQGKYFYKHSDHVYRENKMSENFIREFDQLEGETIMGIYGSAHTGLDSLDFTDTIPSMANQLSQHYGAILYSEDLSPLAKAIDPLRVDTVEVNGKVYEASYFGKKDLTEFEGFSFREFWRLENAFEDFKNHSKTGEVLPYDNYPMLIEEGQIFMIDYTKTDGSVYTTFYISDGRIWEDLPSTEAFTVE